MLTLVEALNYRCLRYVRRPLSPFQVMVGPNASGKTTFLDVITFLRDLLSVGPEEAVRARTQDFRDLVWQRGRKGAFEMAVEARIPEDRRRSLHPRAFELVRYQVRIALDEEQNQFGIDEESVFLLDDHLEVPGQRDLFPSPSESPETLLIAPSSQRVRTVIRKKPGGNDNFYSEVSEKGGKGGFHPYVWDHASPPSPTYPTTRRSSP